MTRRTWALPVVLAAGLAVAAGCSATESRQNHPTAASVVTESGTASAAPSDEGGAAGATSSDPAFRSGPPAGFLGGLAPPDISSPSDVNFPPRDQALMFRQALEVKYRDELRRSTVQTYVDQEGTVVWTQEYLRYRVNLCSHPEAVIKVLRQIDGFGIAPVCGTTTSAVFPPRNEPFDFMLQLEEKYRTGLGRSSGPSFVDVEGNIVWTQEYLRYRVSGCGHLDAQQRVFAQIEGRGVQPDCAGGGGGGSSNVINGSVEALGYVIYEISFTGTGSARYQATLRWADANIDLDLYLTTTACSTYPPSDSCLLTFSDRVGVNAETISWNVRGGDRYYLWVDNFSNQSTSFTIENAISAAGAGMRTMVAPGPRSFVPSGARKAKR
jgi:hypothetical protein